MIYSKSTEYAIRALARLATLPDGSFRMARGLAEEDGLPQFFLAKTMQSLARQGMLKSAKGPSGGFALAIPARKIRLLDVIQAIDGLDSLEHSHLELPGFRPVRNAVLSYLKSTTIADLAARLKKEKKEPAGGGKEKSAAAKKAAKGARVRR